MYFSIYSKLLIVLLLSILLVGCDNQKKDKEEVSTKVEETKVQATTEVHTELDFTADELYNVDYDKCIEKALVNYGRFLFISNRELSDIDVYIHMRGITNHETDKKYSGVPYIGLTIYVYEQTDKIYWEYDCKWYYERETASFTVSEEGLKNSPSTLSKMVTTKHITKDALKEYIPSGNYTVDEKQEYQLEDTRLGEVDKILWAKCSVKVQYTTTTYIYNNGRFCQAIEGPSEVDKLARNKSGGYMGKSIITPYGTMKYYEEYVELDGNFDEMIGNIKNSSDVWYKGGKREYYTYKKYVEYQDKKFYVFGDHLICDEQGNEIVKYEYVDNCRRAYSFDGTKWKLNKDPSFVGNVYDMELYVTY